VLVNLKMMKNELPRCAPGVYRMDVLQEMCMCNEILQHKSSFSISEFFFLYSWC
jgi:hypothetical protein